MTEISPDLQNMTIPVGLSARAATVLAKALNQYEDLCPASERVLVEKLQIELKHAVSRALSDRGLDRPSPGPQQTGTLRGSLPPLPPREQRAQRRSLPKQKSAAEQMAEKMAEAGRAAVDKHKEEK